MGAIFPHAVVEIAHATDKLTGSMHAATPCGSYLRRTRLSQVQLAVPTRPELRRGLSGRRGLEELMSRSSSQGEEVIGV